MLKMILVLLSTLGANAFAQQQQQPAGQAPLSLESAIDEAYDSSPAIKKSEAAVGAARWNENAVFGEGYLPKLEGSATHYVSQKYMTLPAFGTQFAEVGPTTIYTVQATLPVFDGWVSTRKWTASDDKYQAAQKDLEYDKFTLRENVRLAFYEALGAQMIHDVYVQNVKTLDEHLRLTKLLKDNGAATNFDTLRVEVQLNEARSDEIEARDNVELARKKLVQVMGKEQDTRTLVGELPKPEMKLVQNLSIDPNTANRADIEALNLRATAQERIASAEASWMIPKISIVGNYNVYNNQNESFASQYYTNAYALGAMLTWNLFDGNVSQSRAREASYMRIEADKAAQMAKQTLPYELDKWKRKFTSAWDRYNVRTLDVTKSQEEVRLARQEQKAGSRTSSEVLDAEVDMFKAQAGVVNAQLMAAQAMINLEMALGRGL